MWIESGFYMFFPYGEPQIQEKKKLISNVCAYKYSQLGNWEKIT